MCMYRRNLQRNIADEQDGQRELNEGFSEKVLLLRTGTVIQSVITDIGDESGKAIAQVSKVVADPVGELLQVK